MDKKPVVALVVAGVVVGVQVAGFAKDPLTGKIEGIPLAAANLATSTSVGPYYAGFDAITDDVRGAFISSPRLTATDKSSG
jgi:hypothetical protein